MAIDRSSVLHSAQLFASRGQFDAAINEWKRLSAESPGDGSIFNSIGELHLKRQANKDAAAAFVQAANAFRAEGATLKAIATFKKVLKLDPSQYDVFRHLGDLNAERGLLSSAVQDYLTLGKYYLKAGKNKDALDIYKKIVSQDPSNLDAQQRVAELCLQENMRDEATKVYLQLGREQSAQQHYAEAKDAYHAVLRIDPANSEAAQFIEHFEKTDENPSPATKTGAGATGGPSKSSAPPDLLLEAIRRIKAKQFAGAEAILNQLLTKEPGNPEVCQLLAKLHLQRGDIQVALGEYRYLAGAALRAQDYVTAETLITDFLAVEPQSVAMLELFGELYGKKGDTANAVLQYGQAIELLLKHPEPGMPTLHEELFEKITALAPDSPTIKKLTALMPRTTVEELPVPARSETSVSPTTAIPSGPALETHASAQNGNEIDSETHYTLGVAYKNMGLLDEAKQEFRLSMEGPDFFLDSCLMIAVCLKEQGDGRSASVQLELLLKNPKCQGAQAQTIRYELGLIYEAQEQWSQAAVIYESIPTFQDVPQRLESARARMVAAEPTPTFRYGN